MSSSTAEKVTTSSSAWRRPEPGEHRSPCPALNALANGGHIPREGRKITADQLVKAMDTYFGLDPSVGARLANGAMARLGKPGPDDVKVLDLADLALHGFIEHDASLTRKDARNGDASAFVQSLLEQLISISKDGRTITLEDLAVAHQLRMAQSAEGDHKPSLKAGVLGTVEASLLLALLSRDGVIAIPDLVEFLQQERIPAHLTPRRIGPASLFRDAATIAVLGNVPLFDAAMRVRKAVQERL